MSLRPIESIPNPRYPVRGGRAVVRAVRRAAIVLSAASALSLTGCAAVLGAPPAVAPEASTGDHKSPYDVQPRQGAISEQHMHTAGVPPSPQLVSVNITSTPVARVTLDGRFIGFTPLRAFEVTVGVHTLTFTSLDGTLTATRRFRAERGKRQTIVVNLTAGASP